MGKYKINKIYTSPLVSETDLFNYKFCFIGVSLNNPNFYGSRQKAILTWTSKHFEKSLIWIADYSHRLNIQLFQNVDEGTAIETAYHAGDKFENELNQNLQYFPSDKFSVVRKNEIYQQPQYLTYFDTFQALYQQNELFRNSVDNSAHAYLKNQIEKGNPIHIPYEQAVIFSGRYLMEEMAVFGCLVEQGWVVNIYPGIQLPTLEEIAEGKFPNLPASIQKRIFVNLKIHKK